MSRPSARDAVERCLARIAASDRVGPDWRAVLALDPRARDAAERADEERRAGRVRGPLHGLPILIKDNIDVAGLPTSVGTKALGAWRPEQDASVVARLKAAGAIVLGKTNLHELALAGTTASALGGRTLNPHDPARTPGGSSGGSGAALALGYCDGALGTDTLNSLRSPASACGIVALRPTWGLLPRTGIVPVSPSQDVVGPMARDVATLAHLLDAMTGPPDPADPANGLSFGRPAGGYAAALDRGSLRGARLGVVAALFGRTAEQSEVTAIVRGALESLRRAGARLIEIDDPRFDTEAMIGACDVNLIEFREAFDAWAASARPRPPIADLTDLVGRGDCHPSIAEALAKAMRYARATEAPDYLARRRAAGALRAATLKVMAEHRLDALVYPLQKRPAVEIGRPVQPDRNGILAAATGLPAIDIPAGRTKAERPLPVGMDLLGQPWSEARLIALANSAERVLGVSLGAPLG